MSTVLYTLAPTATRIRYREPYLSDALNKKYQSIVPFGIYEGFTPAPSVVAQSLDLQPGSIGHAAVVESDLDNTVQVSVHLDGTLTLDLSAQAGQTVVVLLEATYAYPQETTAYIKMYLEGDPAIPASACTICKVAVPSLAVVLTDADISLTGRTFPWDTRDRNAVPMLALAKNAGFEFVSESTPTIGVAPPYWNLTTGGLGQFQMSNLPGPSGTGGYVIGYSVAAGSAHTNIFYQRYSVPVSSANNRIRFGVRFQPIIQTALNNPVLTVTLINPVTGVIIQTLSIVLDSSAPFLGSWTQYEETLEAYSIGADGACVAQLTLAFNNVQYGTLGEAFYATDFVLEVEADSKAADVGGQLGGDTRFNSLTLTDANYATNKGVVLSHSASTDVMSLAAVPGVTGTPGLYVPGTLTIGGGVVFGGDLTVTGDLYVNGGDIQRSTSGALNVGTDAANVTTLTLGSTATTTLQGNTLNIGTNASNTAINIGTAAPSTTRTLTLGVNSSTLTSSLLGGTITVGLGATSTLNVGSTIANSAAITIGSSTATGTATTVNGVTVSVGGSNTSTLNLGNSSTSSATIRLGNAPTGGSVATTVQGNTVGVGTDADTTAVNVGTTTTPSAAITLGNAPAAGTVATGVAGNAISIGTSVNTTSITIGDGASGTLRVAQYLDGNTGELSLGTNNSYTTTLVTLGNNSTPLTMAGTAINLGTNAASGTMTLSRSGQTTAIAGNATVAGTSTYTGVINANGGIDRSTSGALTIGSTANVTGINIGTTLTTGGVTISRSGENTLVQGNLGVGLAPIAQLTVYGAGQTVSNMSTSTGLGGTLYVRDSGAAPGNGGAVIFGANQGAFSAIKGILADGASNTRGSLVFSNRYAASDSTLTERMRITWEGYVGIGVDPSYKLHVQDTVVGTVNAAVRNLSADVGSYSTFRLGNNADFTSGLVRNSSANTAYGGASSLNLWQEAANPIGLVTNNILRMFVSGAGDVGIGTSSPGATLHIPYKYALADFLLGTHSGGGTSALVVGLSASSGGYASMQAIKNSGSAIGDIVLNKDGGNVGIGIAAPSARLQVVGSSTVASQANVAAVIGVGTTSDLLLGSITGNTPFVASSGAYNLELRTNATQRVTIGSTGNVTINAPTSGTTLGVYTAANAIAVYGEGTGNTAFTLVSRENPTTASYPQLAIQNYSNAGGYPVIELMNSRGTSTAQATVVSGDILGGFNTWGWGSVGGAGFKSATRIEGRAEANFNTALTAGIYLATTNAGIQAVRMTIGGPGNVTINTPTSGDALSVAGTTKVTSGSLYVQNGFWGSALGHDISLSTGSTGSVIQLRPNGSGSADYAYVASAASGKHQFYRGSGAIGVEFDNYPSIHIGAPPSTDTRIAVLAYRSTASTDCWFQAANGSTGSGGGNGFVFGLNTSNEAILRMYETAAMRFYTDNTERMSIGSDGNITISTPTSGIALTINAVTSTDSVKISFVDGGGTYGYVSLNPTAGDKTLSGKAVIIHVHATDFTPQIGGTMPTLNALSTGSAAWYGNAGGVTYLRAHVKVPVGTCITGALMSVLNVTGANQNFWIGAAKLSYTIATSTGGYTTSAILNEQNLSVSSVLTPFPYQWVSWPTLTSNPTIDSDSIMTIIVGLPANVNCRLEAVRIAAKQYYIGRET